MRLLLEFGVRGGNFSSITVDNDELAYELARNIVHILETYFMFFNGKDPRSLEYWSMEPSALRKYWKSSTHYVLLTKCELTDSVANILWEK